ncbi:hypothetical protein C2G38_2044324 [Gigaspora rosea]|uniref:SWIM-type domain-containing protein n=1 Tax=Gigaspora rosea TaxID=44941 RepID=A0A397UJZ0_9GLOM|nr:hypothetical protein C2G38_2044324 [Gigaspora rosea]
MALIRDFDLNDIIEIWEIIGLFMVYKHYMVLLTDGGHLCTCMAIINHGIVCAHFFQVMMNTKIATFYIGLVARRWYRDDLQDTGLEILQRQSIMISTTFQQQVTEIIVPDLHIIKQIRGVNTYSATNQQLCNKKVRYAKGFGKMKKALNLALDFGFDEELINMITLFVDKKMNINDESGSDQLGLTIINDLLVTKHRGRSPTKRLKSSSENQSHDELAHIHHAMNPQDPNLRIPLSNIDPNNSHATDENRRKYVCNICGGSGHNARTCKQNNDSVE